MNTPEFESAHESVHEFVESIESVESLHESVALNDRAEISARL